MDRDILLQFKSLFEEEKHKILSNSNMLNEDFHIKQEDTSDEVDLTSREMQQAMSMRLRNREALYLKKVEGALERIKEGSFGECEECEEEIEHARLKARPTTTLCLSCKEEEERREKTFIDGRRAKSVGVKTRLLQPA